MYMALRRYVVAWSFKYSRPSMMPGMQHVGQAGWQPHYALSGSGIAQFAVGLVLFMQMVVCYKENVHHRFKKYHDFPLSETLMAYLPFNYKSEDAGGAVVLKGVAIDALIAGSLVNCVTASKNAPSAAIGARRAQAGYVGLAAAAALLVLNRLSFNSKSVDLVDKNDRAALANLLGCDSSELDELVKKSEEMKNPLRYSMITAVFVRLYDSVMGSLP